MKCELYTATRNLIVVLTTLLLCGCPHQAPPVKESRVSADQSTVTEPYDAAGYDIVTTSVFEKGEAEASVATYKGKDKTGTVEMTSQWTGENEITVSQGEDTKCVVKEESDKKWTVLDPAGEVLYHITRDTLDGFHVKNADGKEVLTCEAIVGGYKLQSDDFEGVKTEIVQTDTGVSLERYDLDNRHTGGLTSTTNSKNIFSTLWPACFVLPVEVRLGMVTATYKLADLNLR